LFAFAFAFDLLGPSEAAETADKTRGACPVLDTGTPRGLLCFAPGFFAQAKKGGSRRHGAKALDLDLAVAVAKAKKIKSCSLRSHPHPALRATFSRRRENG